MSGLWLIVDEFRFLFRTSKHNCAHVSGVYDFLEQKYYYSVLLPKEGAYDTCTVVPTKSDSDVIFCLQFLSKTLTCTLHLT